MPFTCYYSRYSFQKPSNLGTEIILLNNTNSDGTFKKHYLLLSKEIFREDICKCLSSLHISSPCGSITKEFILQLDFEDYMKTVPLDKEAFNFEE